MIRIVRLFLCFFTVAAALSCSQRSSYITITGFAQGGTYAVKFNTEGLQCSPEHVKDSIDSILQNIDNSLSGYNKKSLLSRFNAGETVTPDSLFADIYSHAYKFWEETDGLVDAASAPLFDLWGFGFKSGEMPSDEVVSRIVKESGMKRLRADIRSAVGEDGTLEPSDLLLDELSGNASLSETAVAPNLNYNAIAQGYSCDLVAAYLYSLGVKDMMVDIGEIYCDGVNPSGKRWTIGIDRPVDGNNELGADIQGIFRVPSGPHGVVTSGNYRKFYVRDGRKYAHTIDPQTGYPVSHSLLSATVLASDAMTADAYATYCMVIGLDAAKAFIESRPDLEACLIYDSDGAFATWCSSGFSLEASATSTR